MNLLPLGSVVTLKNAKIVKKMMIVLRNPVFTIDNVLGYMDYAACIYPVGYEGMEKVHCFNHENIQDIIFSGYVDEMEIKYQQLSLKNEIPYPKFTL